MVTGGAGYRLVAGRIVAGSCVYDSCSLGAEFGINKTWP
jgi:hypothetical protein